MPYASRRQERWAHTATGTKALGGAAKVAEWDAASKGKQIPEKVGGSMGHMKSAKITGYIARAAAKGARAPKSTARSADARVAMSRTKRAPVAVRGRAKGAA